MSREKKSKLQKSRRDALRLLGLCQDCGRNELANNNSRCEECTKKHRDHGIARYNKLKSSGICVRCGVEKSVTDGIAGRCIDCFFKDSAKKISSRGDKKKVDWKYLKELWIEQDGKCSITGVDLIPGMNATVDHIIPRARGGTNEIENLRWVLDKVNRSKDTMLDDEFFEFIELVHRRLNDG